jgi:hypothetical protein
MTEKVRGVIGEEYANRLVSGSVMPYRSGFSDNEKYEIVALVFHVFYSFKFGKLTYYGILELLSPVGRTVASK